MLLASLGILFPLLLGHAMGVLGKVLQFGGALVVLVLRIAVLMGGHNLLDLHAKAQLLNPIRVFIRPGSGDGQRSPDHIALRTEAPAGAPPADSTGVTGFRPLGPSNALQAVITVVVSKGKL